MKNNKLPRGVTHSLLDAVMQAMKHDSSMSKAIPPKVKVATPKTDPIGKNDGKVNNTDGFLAARRRAIAARVAKLKGNKNTNTSPKVAIKGKKDSVDVKPALGESMTSEQYDSEVQWALRSGLTPPIRPAMFAEANHGDDDGWYAHREIHGDKGISAKDWKDGYRMNSKGERVKMNEAHIAMPLKGHDYHTKTDAELRYIRKDAGEASRALKGSNVEGKYLDQVNDAETVLHYRSKGGQRVAKPGSRAHKYQNEEVEQVNEIIYYHDNQIKWKKHVKAAHPNAKIVHNERDKEYTATHGDKLVGKYYRQGGFDSAVHDLRRQHYKNNLPDDAPSNAHLSKPSKTRPAGSSIGGFVAEEVEQVDELSKKTLRSYVDKNKGEVDPRLNNRKTLNRLTGRVIARRKIVGRNIEVKANEEHTQCGTPDCCGQCDTTQVNEAAMSDDAHELMIHGDNNSQLYKSSYVPVAKNLEKKWKKGTYDHEKAKTLWKYHADRASESYKKEHGHMFSPTVRREAAGHYADQHKAEMEAGNMHESLSEARVNQERADSGDDNVLNQLRKIRPTSSKTIRWADGSKSDITLAHRDAALAKHAEVMGGKGPGSYGPDKQAFLKMLGSNEKGFHGALAGKHTERSTVAGFKVRRKGIDEALRGDQHKIDVAAPKGKITSADFKKIRMKKEEAEQVDEKITAKTPTSDVISDFVHSKNPKFADKSKAKRIQMALAASYAKKRGD